MELSDLARRSRVRVPMLVLLPLLVGLALGAVAWQRPHRFTGDATIAAPGEDQGPAVVLQSINDLKTLVVSDAVITKSAHDAGVPVNDVRGNLTVRPIAQSRMIRLHFEGASSKQVSAVLDAVGINALHSLVDRQVTAAHDTLASAQRDHDAAAAKIEAFRASTNLIDPDRQAATRSADLLSAQADLKVAQSTGDSRLLASANTRIARATAALAILADPVRTYSELVAKEAATNRLLANAAVQAQHEDALVAGFPHRVDVGRVARVPRWRGGAKAGGVGLALTLVAMMALFALVDAVRAPRREAAATAVPDVEPTAAPEPDPVVTPPVVTAPVAAPPVVTAPVVPAPVLGSGMDRAGSAADEPRVDHGRPLGRTAWRIAGGVMPFVRRAPSEEGA